MDNQTVIYEIREQIGWVTLNRPEVMNAVNLEMSAEIIRIVHEAEQDNAVRVLVFKGAGDRAFSSGMDLKERAEGHVPSLIERRRQKTAPIIHTHTRAIASMSKPTIAAIRGYAIGGGLEIALACDLRIATEDSKLGLSEVWRGLIPGSGGTQRLPRLIGIAKALEMCLSGNLVDGNEAYRIGLVHSILPPEELLAGAERFAKSFLKGAPLAVRYVKEAIYKGTELSLEQGLRLEADLSALIATTDDSKEGPRAFAERRAPVWKDR
jgi:enoyl-CoA hydratase